MSAALLGCLPWPGKNRPPLVIRMSSCRRNLRGFHLSSAGKAKLMVKLRISYAGEAQLIVEYNHNLSFIYISFSISSAVMEGGLTCESTSRTWGMRNTQL